MDAYREKLISLLDEQLDIVVSDYDVLEDLEEEIAEAEARAYGQDLAWSAMCSGIYNLEAADCSDNLLLSNGCIVAMMVEVPEEDLPFELPFCSKEVK